MSKGQGQGQGDPNAPFVIPVILVVILIAGWMVMREKLYYYAGKMAWFMTKPLDGIGDYAQYRQSIVTQIMNPPDFGLFVTWANSGFRIFGFVMAGICFYSAYKAWFHPYLKMRGQLSVDALMQFQAQVHDPIAPILHLSKTLNQNLDERYHEAYHPHEVVQKFNLANPDGTLNRERAENYFLGQLGTRVYRPGIDNGEIVFADRMNSWEKAIFAMLAPLAIHIKDGLPEYKKLRRALNRSACNDDNMPDLSLANEQYQKYRAHPLLNNLFYTHHFSTTYLFQLYQLAKRAGGFSTADWVGWLRPHATGLYMCLNCSGRSVAFTEAAGPFAQWKYEVKCKNEGKGEDEGFMPILPMVIGAVDALAEEYAFWLQADQGVTEETLWGKMQNRADGTSPDAELFRRYVTDILHVQPPPLAADEETMFDAEQAQARRAAEDIQISRAMSGARTAFPADAPPL